MNELKTPKNALSKTKYLLILIALTCITACSGGSNEFNYDTSVQRLTSITIDGYPLDFNSEKTGPYKIETSNSEKTLSVHFESSGDHSFSYSIQNSNGTYQKTLDDEKNFVANIAEGGNLISIQLYDSEKEVFVTYTIYAYRLSSAARITSFNLYDFAGGSGTSLGLAPSFSEAVFDYSTTAPYSSCAIAYQITAKNSGVSMQTNGNTSYERNVYYHNLTYKGKLFRHYGCCRRFLYQRALHHCHNPNTPNYRSNRKQRATFKTRYRRRLFSICLRHKRLHIFYRQQHRYH